MARLLAADTVIVGSRVRVVPATLRKRLVAALSDPRTRSRPPRGAPCIRAALSPLTLRGGDDDGVTILFLDRPCSFLQVESPEVTVQVWFDALRSDVLPVIDAMIDEDARPPRH